MKISVKAAQASSPGDVSTERLYPKWSTFIGHQYLIGLKHFVLRFAPMNAPAIATEQIVKHFGDVVAVAGVDLEVQPGTVFGLLGPNGAGKTTIVRMLTTILKPTSGRASVLGIDCAQDPEHV